MLPVKKMCDECPYKNNSGDNFMTIGLNYPNVLDFFDGKPVHSCHKIGFSLDDNDKKIGCKGSILFYEKMKGIQHNNIKDFNEMILVH